MEFKAAAAYFFIVCVALAYLALSEHYSTDYMYHLTYLGNGAYAPMLAWIMSPLQKYDIVYRMMELIILNLLFTLYFPFILIHKITGKWEASVVYALSGIPMLLFIVWLMPQSMIQVMMLAAIAYPPIILVLLIAGPFTHEFWFGAVLLVGLYYSYNHANKFFKGIKIPYSS
jgi:membrane protease YdiL (CAAX protease family)